MPWTLTYVVCFFFKFLSACKINQLFYLDGPFLYNFHILNNFFSILHFCSLHMSKWWSCVHWKYVTRTNVHWMVCPRLIITVSSCFLSHKYRQWTVYPSTLLSVSLEWKCHTQKRMFFFFFVQADRERRGQLFTTNPSEKKNSPFYL